MKTKNTLTSKMAKEYVFLTNAFPALCHASSVTLKFRVRWFPEEAGYLAKKGCTDINLPFLMSNEVKNISGSLILD